MRYVSPFESVYSTPSATGQVRSTTTLAVGEACVKVVEGDEEIPLVRSSVVVDGSPTSEKLLEDESSVTNNVINVVDVTVADDSDVVDNSSLVERLLEVSPSDVGSSVFDGNVIEKLIDGEMLVSSIVAEEEERLADDEFSVFADSVVERLMDAERLVSSVITEKEVKLVDDGFSVFDDCVIEGLTGTEMLVSSVVTEPEERLVDDGLAKFDDRVVGRLLDAETLDSSPIAEDEERLVDCDVDDKDPSVELVVSVLDKPMELKLKLSDCVEEISSTLELRAGVDRETLAVLPVSEAGTLVPDRVKLVAVSEREFREETIVEVDCTLWEVESVSSITSEDEVDSRFEVESIDDSPKLKVGVIVTKTVPTHD